LPDYSCDWRTNLKLTGDGSGLRQEWANRGIFVGPAPHQALQGIIDGGTREGTQSSTSLDSASTLDLLRKQPVP
jgi:hypothetical protein